MIDKLHSDILNAMQILGIDCIPSDDDLKSIDMSWLSISVGENNSKYYKYINQWHYIKDYCDFIKGVA